MAIDAHAHFVPETFLAAAAQQAARFPSITIDQTDNGPTFSFCGSKPTRPVIKPLRDRNARLAWLAQHGLTHQVLGGWLDLFGYELPAEEGAAWARLMNEHLLQETRDVPQLSALATVPLQNGALASQVLDEALSAGFKGAIIGTQPKGSGGNLDDPDLEPFWALASSRRATLFIHPMLACTEPRLADYDLVNSLGRVFDTSAALGRLFAAGHVEKYDGIEWLISHGGAVLPFVLGRLEKSFQASRGAFADPRKAFERLHFDTVLFDPAALRFLCNYAGASKVLLGSDHPFALGDGAPLETVEKAGLTEDEFRLVSKDNAMRLFKLQRCECPQSDSARSCT